MQSFKIDIFERENLGKQFPSFRHLSPGESNKMKLEIASRIGMSLNSLPLLLLKEIDARQDAISTVSAINESFNLITVLKELNIAIRAEDEIFINWYRFDNIDCIKLKDLSENFHAVWYPSSDDIDIFDTNISWMLSIDHDGHIKFIAWKGREI